jgi:hypothetical protein
VQKIPAGGGFQRRLSDTPLDGNSRISEGLSSVWHRGVPWRFALNGELQFMERLALRSPPHPVHLQFHDITDRWPPTVADWLKSRGRKPSSSAICFFHVVSIRPGKPSCVDAHFFFGLLNSYASIAVTTLAVQCAPFSEVCCCHPRLPSAVIKGTSFSVGFRL